VYEKILKNTGLWIKIIDEDRYDAVNISDFALVASGTATLETAILGVPMVLVYKVSFLTWFLARILIKIPYIGLVNVVAGEKIIPEFIQFGATPERIAHECIEILQSPARISKMKIALAQVKEKLGPSGASANAASEILAFLDSNHANPAAIR
jgi:lipid-A-disaccharide synthase